MNKQSVLVNLLTESRGPSVGKSLISEITDEVNAPSSSVSFSKPSDDEEPSMLDLMMEAQRAALNEKQQSDIKKKEEESKKSFNGFKKGFFSSGTKPTVASTQKTSISQSNPVAFKQTDNNIIEVKSVKEPSQSKLVFDDVQQAMEEEQHPIFKQLKSQEWVTNDLMSQFRENPVLARGFQNPKCMTAIQLMQKNPKDALKQFQNDPDVTRFLQEFGKVMGAHFEALGTTQAPTPSNPPSPVTKIQEVGPLQAAAAKRKQEQLRTVSSTSASSTTKIATRSEAAAINEEERVQQILRDPDLRSLLMDTDLQKILQECAQPQKLRQHLQNPEVAKKIKRLTDAGLVKMEL